VKENEATLEERMQAVLSDSEDGQGGLIPLLQKVQGEFGYVPEEAIFGISDVLGVPASEVFGVLTFYAQFRLTPQGRNLVRVCRGTACHVRGSRRILQAMERCLGIRFSLEDIACFGSCSLAPVMVVNQDTYGRLTPEKAVQIVESYREDDQDR
jgi:NADH-quinone oxidoreductase subunit E